MDERRCRVRGVFLSMSEQGAAAPTVVLELPGGDCIPIYIGLWEAISIRNAIKGEVLPRPITHDLFVEVLRRFNVVVTPVSVHSLGEGNSYLLCLIDSMWECRRCFHHARGQVLRYHADDEVLSFFDVSYRILTAPVWTVDNRKT